MKVVRFFTKQDQDPYVHLSFVSRTSDIRGAESGTNYTAEVLVPEDWSTVAVDVLVQKYFRKAGVPSETVPRGDTGVPDWLQPQVSAPGATMSGETDVRQVFHRLAGCWAYWGYCSGLFGKIGSASAEKKARVLYDEMRYMLARQMWAPNSPQWFNTGLHWAYGIERPPQGHHFFDESAGKVVPSLSAYERPQPQACFIQSVADDLVNPGGIMDLWVREARLFKYGSGTGTNFSGLRGRGEMLSGGGVSSGLMSWLQIGDRAAAGIKSGGTTRRAAKMVILDCDHPEVEPFVSWKLREQHKVAALVTGSKINERCLNAILAACHNSDIEGEGQFDPKSNVKLADAVLDAKDAFVPGALIHRSIQFARQGYTELELPVLDTDWQGEAYSTVSGQQSNNSVGVTNEFLAAVERGDPWHLTARTTGEVMSTIPAVSLWDGIANAAWSCGDPGVQFQTTMNEWNTCPGDGPIRATNPCSEYAFLDDTACNLASLNLVKFADVDRQVKACPIEIDALLHAVQLSTIVLEISVEMAQLPSPEIALGTYNYRTLGLGFGNIGGLAMRLGLPYDSVEARGLAAGLTAIITGEAYAQSARMASVRGPYARYEANKEHALRVVRNHRRAAMFAPPEDYEGLTVAPRGLHPSETWDELIDTAKFCWDTAVDLGVEHGYRNAQISCIAPTGTIGLVMDCDTTGIEPDFSLIKHKSLAGGGTFLIINQSIPLALSRLGYDDATVAGIVDYVTGHRTLEPRMRDRLVEVGFTSTMLSSIENELGKVMHLSLAFHARSLWRDALLSKTKLTESELDSGVPLLSLLGFSDAEVAEANLYSCGALTIEGAPGLAIKHYAVFDCSSRCGWNGTRFIAPTGHLQMMGAVQPFVSGAISKTINFPAEATVADMQQAYWLSWKLGLKAVALYRDGSKLSQPLGARVSKDLFEGLERVVAPPVRDVVEQIVVRYLTDRRKLPNRRKGYTQKVVIGGHKVFLHTGEYEDGTLGELFVELHKEGAAFRSLMNAFAIAVSIGLQHGVPLERFVSLFTFQKFEPNGMVMGDDDPAGPIRMCTSIVDWLFRHLAVNYLDRKDLAHISPTSEALQPSTIGDGSRGPEYHGERVLSKGPVMLTTVPIEVNEPGLPKSETGEQLILNTHLGRKGPVDSGSPSLALGATGNEPPLYLDDATIAAAGGYEGDACPSCCELKMVRNGSCLKCASCGETTGCS